MTTFPTFDDFFRDLHDYDPYPWQSRLAHRVNATDSWPTTIKIPTGLGKTACIDIALWNLAHQVVHRGPTERTAPLRIFHVVDRRAIIDQTHLGFDRFAQGEGAAAQVFETLTSHFGEAIHFGRIHGEAPDNLAWLRTHVPAVISLTAHQFVSRLLFRGYGISSGMSPIHAGLTGIDRLVLFDEPHLSEPAVRTILAQQRLQASAPESAALGVPLGQVVLLGATPPPPLPADSIFDTGDVNSPAPADLFELDARDLAHPGLQRRVHASRELVLHESAATDDAVRKALVVAAQKATDTVLVMTNTVNMAQRVYADLTATFPGETLLVTSRFRGHDKTILIERLLTEADGPRSGGDSPTPMRPRVVVATQTLEAGVDLSFHTLVTEPCPWPALAQRVGRLNRTGELEHAEVHLVTGITKGTAAVYDESAVSATVETAATLDSLAVSNHSAFAVDGTWGHRTPAPTLHAGHLPVLAHSRPRPVTDIDIAPFIAGRREAPLVEDVRVCWRTELSPAALLGTPPMMAEIVDVPVAAVRRLALRASSQDASGSKAAKDEFGDAAFSPDAATGTLGQLAGAELPQRRPVDGTWEPVMQSGQIRPGDTVVFPVGYGGYTSSRGWDSASRSAVTDLSSLALDEGPQRRWFTVTPATLRGAVRRFGKVDPTVLQRFDEEIDTIIAALLPDDSATIDLDAFVTERIVPLLTEAGSPPLGMLVARAISTRSMIDPDSTETLLYVRLRDANSPNPSDHRSEDASLTLEDHANQTAREASNAAALAGLGTVRSSVEHAALTHDDGKVDPRFQKYLRLAGAAVPRCDRTYNLDLGENPEHERERFAVKSGQPRPTSAEAHRQRQRSGLPDGWSHGAHSGQFLWHREVLDLVVHLAEAHHGGARPLDNPDSLHRANRECDCDAAAVRFAALNERFGPWGLAYLEANVRLADHRASAETHPGETVPALLPLPRREPDVRTAPATTHSIDLPGLAGRSPLNLWAAFGVFVAAVDCDPHAKFWFRDDVQTQIPVIETSAAFEDIVVSLAQTPELIQEAEDLLAGVTDSTAKILRRKNQKVPIEVVARVLQDLPAKRNDWTHAQSLVAAIASDAYSTKGMVELRTPFIASNANGFASALIASGTPEDRRSIIRRLLTDPDDQTLFDDGNVHGLAEEQLNTAILTGLGDGMRATTRTAAMIPVVYGTKALATNGVDAFSTEHRTMWFPIPTVPLTMTDLMALWRTAPRHPRQHWGRAGLREILVFTKTLHGYFNYYHSSGVIHFDQGRADD